MTCSWGCICNTAELVSLETNVYWRQNIWASSRKVQKSGHWVHLRFRNYAVGTNVTVGSCLTQQTSKEKCPQIRNIKSLKNFLRFKNSENLMWNFPLWAVNMLYYYSLIKNLLCPMVEQNTARQEN